MQIDAFVDWTRTSRDFDAGRSLDRLRSDESLGEIGRAVTCVLPHRQGAGDVSAPAGWRIESRRPLEACRDAMAAAAADGHPLLILLGDIRPGSAAVGLLLEAVESDPMIGFAFPRLSGTRDGTLARLDAAGDPAIDELPRRVLSELPPEYLVADVPARCLVIKPAVLANFAELDCRFQTLAGALWHYMARARRCGFRTLACNRAVVMAPSRERPCPPCVVTYGSLTEGDRVLLRESGADVERTIREFGTGPAAAAETRLARSFAGHYGVRPSLLLDARNVGPSANGTATAALGVASGLHALDAEWEVTLLAQQEACAAYHLEKTFNRWKVSSTLPQRQFTVALRLSQPWHIQEIIDLHAVAAYNTYLFLDTIAWDTVYPAPRHLDGTWQFMAAHADALLFISAYSRDRFLHRFPAARSLPSLVSHLSFAASDYVLRNVKLPRTPYPSIFIVGNGYDHKDVSPTMELLAAAFPYETIVALGAETAATPRVKVLRSGDVSEAEMHKLYAGARVVVFPSFYEGFGLPVVTTLAYGGTVVARQSSLLEEIAAHCEGPGRIVPFTRRDDLVDLVGRLLHGETVPALPLGNRPGDHPHMSWRDVGARVLSFLSELTGDPSRSHWRLREHTIGQLVAAPTPLVATALRAR